VTWDFTLAVFLSRLFAAAAPAHETPIKLKKRGSQRLQKRTQTCRIKTIQQLSMTKMELYWDRVQCSTTYLVRQSRWRRRSRWPGRGRPTMIISKVNWLLKSHKLIPFSATVPTASSTKSWSVPRVTKLRRSKTKFKNWKWSWLPSLAKSNSWSASWRKFKLRKIVRKVGS